jgi:hypothetical protein
MYYYNQNNYPPPVNHGYFHYPVPIQYNNMYAYGNPYVSRPNNQLPKIDTKLFNESAHAFQSLMIEASKIINQIASSKQFAFELMSAAQASNQHKVDQLIASTGASEKVKTTFNPDGLKIILLADVENSECCQLIMNMRWR